MKFVAENEESSGDVLVRLCGANYGPQVGVADVTCNLAGRRIYDVCNTRRVYVIK